MRFGLLSLLFATAQQLCAQPVLRIDLNTANCRAHVDGVRQLNSMSQDVAKIIVLADADSLSARRQLSRLGIDLENNISIQYEQRTHGGGSLIDGIYSRARCYLSDEVVLDINLDTLSQYVSLVNTLAFARMEYDSVSITARLGFASGARFAGNLDCYWVLDRTLGDLYCLPFASHQGGIVPHIWSTSLDAYRNVAAMASLPVLQNFSATDTVDLLSLRWAQPQGLRGQRIDIIATVRTDTTAESPKRGRSYEDRELMLGFNMDSIITAKPMQRASTAEDAIIPQFGFGGFGQAGDSLLAQVLRFGAADSYPFFAWFRSVDDEIRRTSISSFEHPKAMWERGYKYQFTNGVFGNDIFAFTMFPFVVSTNDMRMHDVSAALGVSLDSAFAREPRHFFCKAVYQDDHMMTMLVYLKKQLSLVHFVDSNFKSAQIIPIDCSRVDPVSMVLIDHNHLIAIDQDRLTLWRLTMR